LSLILHWLMQNLPFRSFTTSWRQAN
jgi:hypothetical protein